MFLIFEVKDRFPEWFKVELDFLCYSLKVLAKKRELSFYGGEEALLSPNEVINKEDAEDAVFRAERTYQLCKRLSEELK